MNENGFGRRRIQRSLWLVMATILALSLPARSQDAEVTHPDPNRFLWEIQSFVDWDRGNSYPRNAILFIGSSSIRLWSTAAAFSQYPVINRGFGGSHISDVNYYFDLIVGKYKPAVIVFYAGDNDIADKKSVQDVYGDYVKFARRVAAELPGTRIIYLAIKPSMSRWQYWKSMRQVNTLIEDFTKSDGKFYYADIATPMMGRDGRPRPELFLPDGLHLNNEGYRLWEAILRRHLTAAFEEIGKESGH